MAEEEWPSQGELMPFYTSIQAELTSKEITQDQYTEKMAHVTALQSVAGMVACNMTANLSEDQLTKGRAARLALFGDNYVAPKPDPRETNGLKGAMEIAHDETLGMMDKTMKWSTMMQKKQITVEEMTKLSMDESAGKHRADYKPPEACADYDPMIGCETACRFCLMLKSEHDAAAIQTGEARRALQKASLEQKSDKGGKPKPAGPKNMEEDELCAKLVKFVESTKDKQMVIFAGAGVSMSAPSASPSWWGLMNDLLKRTFDSVEKTGVLEGFKQAKEDVSRQPEELMETYHTLLNDKLFTLFKLLEFGKPNANHVGMAKMAKKGKVRAIFTTNFDTFIERALKDEGVDYKLIVDTKDFETYVKQGCPATPVAVLKIHGTADVPNTVVAVAHDYKGGKGFAGMKAEAFAQLMKIAPVLYVGYSGADYVHYQPFWEKVGEDGGADIFWTNFRGATGGPDLRKLVGKHIGLDRFIIGDTVCPDFLALYLNAIKDKKAADETMKYHKDKNTDKEYKAVVKERDTFVAKWVQDMSEPTRLNFILLEAMKLNEAAQERSKETKGDSGKEGYGGQSNVAELMMRASTSKDPQYEGFMEAYTLEATFKTAPNRIVAEELIREVMAAKEDKEIQSYKDHPLTKVMSYPPEMLYRMVAMTATISFFKDNAKQVIARTRKGMKWLMDSHKKGKKGEFNDKFYQLMTNHAQGLIFIHDKKEGKEALKLLEAATKEVLKQEKETSQFNANSLMQPVLKKVNQFYYGSIDQDKLQATLVKSLMSLKKDADFLEEADLFFLCLCENHLFTAAHWLSRPVMQGVTSRTYAAANKPLKDAPKLLAALNKNDAEMRKGHKSLQARLEKLTKHKKDKTLAARAKQVLAALHFTRLHHWARLHTINSGTDAIKEYGKSADGEYKRTTYAQFQIDHLLLTEQTVDFAALAGGRFEQRTLAYKAMVAEAQRDNAKMREIVDASLKLTGGKVSELTLEPIPECLAIGYENADDSKQALEYYALALEGAATCVLRSQLENIVWNACRCAVKAGDEKKALDWGLHYAPKWTGAAVGLVTDSRKKLNTGMEEWAKGQGFKDAKEAYRKIILGEE